MLLGVFCCRHNWFARLVEGNLESVMNESAMLATIATPPNDRDTIELLQKAQRMQPDNPQLWDALGAAYLIMGDLRESLRSYTRAVELRPHEPLYQIHLAQALLKKGEWEQAAVLLKHLVHEQTISSTALTTLGHISCIKGEWTAAEQQLHKALAINAYDHDAHTLLGSLYYAQGKIEEGRAHFGYALQRGALLRRVDLDEIEPWNGAYDLQKTILLYAEGSLAEIFCTLRFVRVVHAMVKKIILHVPENIVKICQQSFAGLEIISCNDALPAVDAWISLLECPARLNLQQIDLPACAFPYLKTFRENLFSLQSARQVRSSFNIAIFCDHTENGLAQTLLVAPEHLLPLMQNDRVHIHMFGVDEQILTDLRKTLPTHAQDRLFCGYECVPLENEFDIFLPEFYASVLGEMDLCITDHADVAALAGAYGGAQNGEGSCTLVFASMRHDYWMLQNEKNASPWYPQILVCGLNEALSTAAQSILTHEAQTVFDASGLAEKKELVAITDAEWVEGAASDEASLPHVDDLLREAFSSHQEGDLEHAEMCYQAILEHEPQQNIALHHLGVIALQRGQYDIAETRLRHALDFSPQSLDVQANLALVLKAQGHYDEAIELCRKIVDQQPDHSGARHNLANMLFTINRFVEAAEHYEVVLALSPPQAKLHNQIAQTYFSLGKIDKALEHFSAAAALEPERLAYKKAVTRCLLHQSQWQKAWASWASCAGDPFVGLPDAFSAFSTLPQWSGEALTEAKLFVTIPHNVGPDEIMMLRFISLAKAWVGSVTVLCSNVHHAFMERVVGVDEVWSETEHMRPLTTKSVQCDLLMLASILGVTADGIRSTLPYLKSDILRRIRWRTWRAAQPAKVYALTLTRENVDSILEKVDAQLTPSTPQANDSAFIRRVQHQHERAFVVLLEPELRPLVERLQQQGVPLILLPEPFAHGEECLLDIVALLENLDGIVGFDCFVPVVLAQSLGKPIFIDSDLIHKDLHTAWWWTEGNIPSPWFPQAQPLSRFWDHDFDALNGATKERVTTKPQLVSHHNTADADLNHQNVNSDKSRTTASSSQEHESSSLVQKAQNAQRNERLVDAEKFYRQALDENPQSPEAWLGLGQVGFRCGKYDQARDALQKAKKFRETMPLACLELGHMALETHQIDSALQHFQDALKLRPGWAEAYIAMADGLVHAERMSEALRYYRGALALRPQDKKLLYKIGTLYQKMGQFAQAEALFKEAQTMGG